MLLYRRGEREVFPCYSIHFDFLEKEGVNRPGLNKCEIPVLEFLLCLYVHSYDWCINKREVAQFRGC